MFRCGLSWLIRAVAAFALLLFVGDIVVDAAADLCGDHCVSQSAQEGSDHEKGPCSHCSCATHNGAVVVTDDNLRLSDCLQVERLLPPNALRRMPKLAVSIDHPPQLG